jgi:hypothetical protein
MWDKTRTLGGFFGCHIIGGIGKKIEVGSKSCQMVVPSECWYKKKNRLDQRAKFPYTYFVISSLFNLDGECLTMSYFDNLNDEFQINTKKS